MLPYMLSHYGNAHSRTHAYGWESEKAVEKARKVQYSISDMIEKVIEKKIYFIFICVIVQLLYLSWLKSDVLTLL